jgi:ABC-type methionine transport system permease subunit
MIPHVIVLEPGLVIYKIYKGYWFFGRPTLEDLRQDLLAVLKKCRPDWDITTSELKAAWQRPVEGLRSLGARPVQCLLWAIWPQARPRLSSYTFLRWEMKLRASTILGLVGGGSLGQAIHNNVQLGFYPRLSTLILYIFLTYALVLTSDWNGERLRLRVAWR